MSRAIRGETMRTMHASARRFSLQTWFLATVVAASCAVVGYIVLVDLPGRRAPVATAQAGLTLQDIPFDGTQAYEYLKQVCALGPRPSGSTAMAEQRKLLKAHFHKLGGKTVEQTFRIRHPLDGSAVDMANLIVEWHPERRERILVGVHYDTRPFPDQDPMDPRGAFIGANDGGSGVALLMQLGAAMKELKGKYGVDFVFFDGEEFIFDERGRYFVGSTHFAEQYVAQRPKYRYVKGVILDMVGDRDLQLLEEGNSMAWPPSRKVVLDIWGTAKRLGVHEFIPQVGHVINDDHVPLCQIAKIPTCDVIDFDYPYWHTQADTVDKCSALSLAKVGWVVEEWLKEIKSN